MADQTLRIGIVGAGGIVRSRHVPGFADIAGVTLEAVVNTTRAASERAAAELGIARVHDHWRDLVRDPEIDAVVVGTWPDLHAPVTVAALQAGKHVLCQARLARDAAEGRAIARAAAARPDLVTMIVPSPITLWADACVRRIVASGEIGELRLVRAFWGGGDGPLAIDPGWRRDRRISGNNTLALGIMYEALARWVGHAVWVQASEQIIEPYSADGQPADVPDLVCVQAELAGGARLSLDMSPHARFGGPTCVYLFGSTGTLLVNIDEERLVLRREGALQEVTPRPDERAGWRVEAEFVGAIRGTERVHRTDVATAVRYMEFTDAVRRSANEGRRIGF